MRLTSIISSWMLFMSSIGFAAEESESRQCAPEDIPKLIHPIDNWHMVLGNTSQISASDAFSGNKILYSISALVHDPNNKVMINRRNGIVRIEAVSKEEFEVTVTATNPCGNASAVFNVKITSEE